MKNGIILTLPRYDDTTEYLSNWSYEIKEESNKKGIKIKLLKDKKANREEFEKTIKKLDPRLLILNGHGSKTSIHGNNDEILVEEGKNDEILIDKITYSRSCDSASSLGIKCMEKNKKGCFIGYKVKFTFYINNKWSSNPRKDRIAGLFLSSSNLIPISLIKGNSSYESHERAKKMMLKNMNKILKAKTKDSFLIASALWNNYSGQVILGNKESRLFN